MDFKDSKECMGVFGRRNGRAKVCNYTIISKQSTFQMEKKSEDKQEQLKV